MKSEYSVNSHRTTHFQYPTLDKIHGEPTLDTLLHLFRQLKINAQSVPTQLGGGQLGYLALILTPTEYAAIPNTTPFVHPTDPGVFQYVPPQPAAASTSMSTRSSRTSSGTPTTQGTQPAPSTIPSATVTIDITQQKAQHDERKRRYYECQAVEQTLRQQLVEAISTEYLEALRDPITQMIQSPIPDIIAFLQDSFGQITPQELADREDALKNLTYDPWKPVDLVFNKINQFKDLCELCKNQKTDTQLVQLAYLIFIRTRTFTEALRKWNKKPTADKTYTNMITHMRQHYQALKQVGALAIEDSSLNNHANLVQELARNQEELVQGLKNDLTEQIRSNMVDAMMLLQQAPSLTDTDSSSSIATDSINSVTTNSTLATILSSMKSLEQEIHRLKSTRPAPTASTNSSSINPRTGKPWKRYCWTCGCCPHSSRHCPIKAQGHQDDASFANRKGGSNKDCRPNNND